MMLDQIRVVTVTFNSAAVIERFLKSIPEGVETLVVDNASTDNTVDLIKKCGFQPLELKENLGFGTGCNRGAAGNRRPYVFFVNPDSTVDLDSFISLTRFAHTLPKMGAINPAIRDEAGKIRLNRRSTLIPKKLWTDKSLARDDTATAEVAILSGAALFCAQSAFEAVNGFDETIFLYHEDDDLCFRLRQAGYSLHLFHPAQVMHVGGGSTGGSSQGVAFKAYHIAQSRMYVEMKHGQRFVKLKGIFRAISKFISPAMLVRRKRIQAIGFFKGTLDFLNAGAGPLQK